MWTSVFLTNHIKIHGFIESGKYVSSDRTRKKQDTNRRDKRLRRDNHNYLQ